VEAIGRNSNLGRHRRGTPDAKNAETNPHTSNRHQGAVPDANQFRCKSVKENAGRAGRRFTDF